MCIQDQKTFFQRQLPQAAATPVTVSLSKIFLRFCVELAKLFLQTIPADVILPRHLQLVF